MNKILYLFLICLFSLGNIACSEKSCSVEIIKTPQSDPAFSYGCMVKYKGYEDLTIILTDGVFNTKTGEWEYIIQTQADSKLYMGEKIRNRDNPDKFYHTWVAESTIFERMEQASE